MQRYLGLRSVALFVAVLIGVATNSHAAHITLNGGYVGDGWVAPPNVVTAYNVGGGATAQTIQGVTFAPWTTPGAPPSSASANAGTSVSNYADPTYPSSVNPSDSLGYNTALGKLVGPIFYNPSSAGVGPLVFTITGLNPGGSYLVDEFLYSVDNTRTNETFTINGVQTDQFDMTTGKTYLVANVAVASGLGVIYFGTSSPPGATPELGGFLLASVPEPSSFVLLGLGAALLLWKGRRRA